jgi:ABC-type transport system involved in cytochrome c biogenesis permease component
MTFLPIIDRELRVMARKPGTYWLRFGSALAGLFLLAVVAGESKVSITRSGGELFRDLSACAEAACLMAGVFLTADCVSREKRDETLGLLFLTDLKGHDIVLGKVVAASLHTVYGLLAICPLLALTLLLGGVTGGEFWRMVLVMMATLIFSLGLGVLVSTFSRQPRYAMGGVFLTIVLIAAVLPMIYVAVRRWQPLLWPNPVYSWSASFQAAYARRSGARGFWASLATVGGLGIAFLTTASLSLPRAWQESRRGGFGGQRAERLREARFGTREFRAMLRAKLMWPNPYHWVASRDRSVRNLGWVLFGSMMGLWLCLFAGVYIAPTPTNWEAFWGALFIAGGLNVTLKFLVAWEASRRLHDDRASGALELLLVTPLSETQILDGQRRSLLHGFAAPMALLMVAGAGMMLLAHGPGPMSILMRVTEKTILIEVCGAMLMVACDFFALGWVGMWMGLRARKHHHAVLSTLGLVVLVPWLACVPVLLSAWGGAADQLDGLLVFWFALGGVNDVVLALIARAGLRREFRRLASSDAPVEPDREQGVAGVEAGAS